jgi:hypothetical protein
MSVRMLDCMLLPLSVTWIPNVKGMKLFGVSEMESLFKFYIKEIATLFDLPRLLKCTRNLFRRYEGQMKSEPLGNRLHVIAKWRHVSDLYQFAKPHEIRLHYKVTDSHLNPISQ